MRSSFEVMLNQELTPRRIKLQHGAIRLLKQPGDAPTGAEVDQKAGPGQFKGELNKNSIYIMRYPEHPASQATGSHKPRWALPTTP